MSLITRQALISFARFIRKQERYVSITRPPCLLLYPAIRKANLLALAPRTFTDEMLSGFSFSRSNLQGWSAALDAATRHLAPPLFRRPTNPRTAARAGEI